MPGESALVGALRSGPGEALSENGRSTSYEELVRDASTLAAALRRHGVGPGAVVPVQGAASRETVTQIVAVLMTGAAYAPIDSRTPDAAVAVFAHLCGASVVLGTRRHSRSWARWMDSVEVVADTGRDAWVHAIVPDDTMYVIATSGTSGAPKGVVVSATAVAAYLDWAMAEYGTGRGHNVPLFTSLGFDLTVTSLLGPLFTGRGLTVLDPVRWPLHVATNPQVFDRAWFVKLTPSQLDILCGLMVETGTRSTVPLLVVGGEAMRGPAVVRWRDRFPAAVIVNEYGPSEATVGCCRFLVPDNFTDGDVPIGTPPPGVSLQLAPLPVGYAGTRAGPGDHGELVIAGSQVASGYLVAGDDGRGTLNPFDIHDGQRRYVSGDHVSRTVDGLFTYHGRIGREAKINGFRVNLAAIESHLVQCPGVLSAAVASFDSAGLTAHVVVNDTAITARTLRLRLLEFFPAYAVPGQITVSAKIAVNERGKVATEVPSPCEEEQL